MKTPYILAALDTLVFVLIVIAVFIGLQSISYLFGIQTAQTVIYGSGGLMALYIVYAINVVRRKFNNKQ